MYLTWKGTNTVLLEAAGERILFDPFVEIRGAEHEGALEEYLSEETIFITHGHFDHLLFVPELLPAGRATVLCTGTPARTLERYTQGQEGTDQVAVIAPGMELAVGGVKLRVLQGRHIRFDLPLILRTVFSPRMLLHVRNLPFLLWAFSHYPEGKETLVYEILAEGKRIQLLGSLNLDPRERYRSGADLLVMPYQGKSRKGLVRQADRVIAALRPRRILLTHFDDAFPPFSSRVDLRGLRRLMREKYPGIAVVRPVYGRPVRL